MLARRAQPAAAGKTAASQSLGARRHGTRLATAEAHARAILDHILGLRALPDHGWLGHRGGLLIPCDREDCGGSAGCSVEIRCLVAGAAPVVDLKVKFLQLVTREPGLLAQPLADLPRTGEPHFVAVRGTEIGGRRYIAGEETIERAVPVMGFAPDEWLHGTARIPFAFAARRRLAPIRAEDGAVAAIWLRTTAALEGEVTLGADEVGSNLFRIRLGIENTSAGEREGAAGAADPRGRAFFATCAVLCVSEGAFISLNAPPEPLTAAARACVNCGNWPVLIGAPGESDLLLAAPVPLTDYPQSAAPGGGPC
jgi:hypothetical protein